MRSQRAGSLTCAGTLCEGWWLPAREHRHRLKVLSGRSLMGFEPLRAQQPLNRAGLGLDTLGCSFPFSSANPLMSAMQCRVEVAGTFPEMFLPVEVWEDTSFWRSTDYPQGLSCRELHGLPVPVLSFPVSAIQEANVAPTWPWSFYPNSCLNQVGFAHLRGPDHDASPLLV